MVLHGAAVQSTESIISIYRRSCSCSPAACQRGGTYPPSSLGMMSPATTHTHRALAGVMCRACVPWHVDCVLVLRIAEQLVYQTWTRGASMRETVQVPRITSRGVPHPPVSDGPPTTRNPWMRLRTRLILSRRSIYSANNRTSPTSSRLLDIV